MARTLLARRAESIVKAGNPNAPTLPLNNRIRFAG